jgi:hypothetical protein
MAKGVDQRKSRNSGVDDYLICMGDKRKIYESFVSTLTYFWYSLTRDGRSLINVALVSAAARFPTNGYHTVAYDKIKASKGRSHVK